MRQSAEKNNSRSDQTWTDKGFSDSGDSFRRFAHHVSHIVGTPLAFVIALVTVLAWAVTGPVFHFSDTWQLVINTGTTVVTFLMVFLIQSTQNRDAIAIQLKLDELIRANQRARNEMVALETLSERELQELEQEFERLRVKAHHTAETKAAKGSPRSTADGDVGRRN